MTARMTREEASALPIDPALRKLLTPQEVARLCVLPLSRGADGNTITLAADPAAPGNAEMVLRMRLGVRRVELRPATRQAMQILLDAHLIPYWSEKGWQFPGLPDLPELAAPKAEPAAMASAPADAAKSAAGAAPPAEGPKAPADHPAVLVVDSSESRRKPLSELLLEAGYEPRSATTLEAVERELRRAPPSVVIARADGPVPIDALVPLVRKAGGAVELRVLRDYAGALLGSAADERVPTFLFDLVRFFPGIVSAPAGTTVHRTEARAQAVDAAARHMGLPPS